MSFVDPITPLKAFCVSGKIGTSAGTGRATVGLTSCGDHFFASGIYQNRMTKKGKVPVRMRFYKPTNPQTEPQQANRQKFADAMSAWSNLTTEQKQEYNQRGKRRQMFGWGLFIKEYYQSNS